MIKCILEEGINLLPKILKIALSTKRSEKIRQDLKVKSVIKKNETKQLRLSGRAFRMYENKTVNMIWDLVTIEKRRKRRPRRTWNDETNDILRRK